MTTRTVATEDDNDNHHHHNNNILGGQFDDAEEEVEEEEEDEERDGDNREEYAYISYGDNFSNEGGDIYVLNPEEAEERRTRMIN